MAEDFKQEIDSGCALLIDVRTDEEWAEGHAEGAVHMDLVRIMHGEAPDVPKTQAIYLYCHSGNRSGMAETLLKKKGFVNTRNLGGLSDVEAMGIPTVK